MRGEGMKIERFYKKYLFPGVVFQSVVMAGGYGTGREIAEYFFPGGSLGGLLGLLIAVPVIWGLVCAGVFEIQRREKVWDYHGLSRVLLKDGWRIYELVYFLFLLLVLAVALAACGELSERTLGLPAAAGSAAAALVMGVMAVAGERTISRIFSGWSFFLVTVYLCFFISCGARFGFPVLSEVRSGWLSGGLRYAFYNLGSLPAILFAARGSQTTRDAVASGAICGILGVLPALLLYYPLACFLPDIQSELLPVSMVLKKLASPLLSALMNAALVGTLCETGTGLIFSVCRRFSPEHSFRSDLICSSGLLLCGFALSLCGMGELVEKGYGAMSWAFMAVLTAPLCVYWLKTGVLRRFSPKNAQKGACTENQNDI